MLEMRINGYGGQGSVTLAHLLAEAALVNGKKGQALPFFGVERRGAHVRASVRISPDAIHAYSRCEEPDMVIVMSEKLAAAARAEGIKAGGTFVINAPHAVTVDGYAAWHVDADAIATGAGLLSANGPFINVPLFGALCKVLGLSESVLEKTLLGKWPGSRGEQNVKAAKAAYAAVRKDN
ncbi:MAG TPA: pyruvate ferredoxin oxidoreductase [Desulfobulbaceae bacterium]|nr:pyruvate ferredoxin oxidoreductase [Desulfobulbaceae bacterium]